MKAQTTTVGWRARRIAWLAVALSAATAGWLLWSDNVERTTAQRVTAQPKKETLLQLAKPPAPLAAVLKDSEPGALPAIDRHAAVHADVPDHVEQERPHSHPIDNERRRIYRENNLSAAMMGAMNVGDYHGLRALIDEYRMAYPQDEFQLQEGYSLVADCLERVTAERQRDAREYWQQHRSSLVRRFIRRHCLERPVVNG